MSLRIPTPGGRAALLALVCLSLIEPRAARADAAAPQTELERQAQLLLDQQRVIEEQRAMLARQESLLDSLLKSAGSGAVPDADLGALSGRGPLPAEGAGSSGPSTAAGEAAPLLAPASKVGQAPEERGAPEVTALADLGGVLTPRGRLVIEPQQQFGTANINRFSFLGIEVADSVLIGLVDASDANRTSSVTSIGARYGITSRFEVDTKLPFVMRSDSITRRIISTAGQAVTSDDLSARGLGDIEAGMKYQLTRGENDWPFLIANLRLKSTTGSHPFRVKRNDQGIATELATGSGFWAVQPSLTAIKYSDPAVFFGNLSYTWNMSDNVNERITSGRDSSGRPITIARIGNVAPGSAIGMNFGMSLALNERASFNLGYDHQFVSASRTDVSTCFNLPPAAATTPDPNAPAPSPAPRKDCKRSLHSESLQIGSFVFGLSYATKRGDAYSLLLSLGATEDAPDVQLTFRAPFNLDF